LPLDEQLTWSFPSGFVQLVQLGFRRGVHV
jgi:hypothetical protein